MFFQSAGLFAAAFLGAFLLYVLQRLQQKQPFSIFQAININVGSSASPLLVLIDMVISSLLGAWAVTVLTSPATLQQAIIAGLGMTGLLSIHTKDEDKPDD